MVGYPVPWKVMVFPLGTNTFSLQINHKKSSTHQQWGEKQHIRNPDPLHAGSPQSTRSLSTKNRDFRGASKLLFQELDKRLHGFFILINSHYPIPEILMITFLGLSPTGISTRKVRLSCRQAFVSRDSHTISTSFFLMKPHNASSSWVYLEVDQFLPKNSCTEFSSGMGKPIKKWPNTKKHEPLMGDTSRTLAIFTKEIKTFM